MHARRGVEPAALQNVDETKGRAWSPEEEAHAKRHVPRASRDVGWARRARGFRYQIAPHPGGGGTHERGRARAPARRRDQLGVEEALRARRVHEREPEPRGRASLHRARVHAQQAHRDEREPVELEPRVPRRGEREPARALIGELMDTALRSPHPEHRVDAVLGRLASCRAPDDAEARAQEERRACVVEDRACVDAQLRREREIARGRLTKVDVARGVERLPDRQTKAEHAAAASRDRHHRGELVPVRVPVVEPREGVVLQT